MKVLPKICKAKVIRGNSLCFRDATVNDAEFILGLRTNIKKSAFLSKVSPDLSDQITWLEVYTERNDQAYFIIEDCKKNPLGTVRLYDSRGLSFCWGSWILKDGIPPKTAIESVLMIYAYAIDYLGFEKSHFDIRKGNERVWKFHERFGAVRVSEDRYNYEYIIDKEGIMASRKRYKKVLPNGLKVLKENK